MTSNQPRANAYRERLGQPIMPGWNYAMQLYRLPAELLNGRRAKLAFYFGFRHETNVFAMSAMNPVIGI